MTDKYIEGGGTIEEQLIKMLAQLREAGAKGTPVLSMRQALFRALAGTVKMDTEPPCLIIQGEPIAVSFDESIPEERIETEGATGYSSDIKLHFFQEASDD